MSLLRRVFSKTAPSNVSSSSNNSGQTSSNSSGHLRWIRRRPKEAKPAYNMTSEAGQTQQRSSVNPNTSSVSWLSNKSKKSSQNKADSNRPKSFAETNGENFGEARMLNSLEQRMKGRHDVLIIGSDPKKMWKLEDEIGDGAFGKVHKSRNRFTDQLAAIKVFEKCDEDELEDALMEVEILKDCKHRNIVRLYDAFLYEKILWV